MRAFLRGMFCQMLGISGAALAQDALLKPFVLGSKGPGEVAQAVEAGLAIGVAPYFLFDGRPGLVDLSGHLAELDIELWLLTHPDVRHLRRVKVFFEFVRERLVLP
mgnify:CR=1 FL=1